MEFKEMTKQLTQEELNQQLQKVFSDIMKLIKYNGIWHNVDPLGIVHMDNMEMALVKVPNEEPSIQVNYRKLPDPVASNDNDTRLIESVDDFKELYETITEEKLKDVPEETSVDDFESVERGTMRR